MKKRYRFTGKEKDNESGLYYMAARYYCSSTAQFLSVDPKAEEYAHQSAYCYAECNPMVKNDPSGMQAEKNPPPQIPSFDSFLQGAKDKVNRSFASVTTRVVKQPNVNIVEEPKSTAPVNKAEAKKPEAKKSDNIGKGGSYRGLFSDKRHDVNCSKLFIKLMGEHGFSTAIVGRSVFDKLKSASDKNINVITDKPKNPTVHENHYYFHL